MGVCTDRRCGFVEIQDSKMDGCNKTISHTQIILIQPQTTMEKPATERITAGLILHGVVRNYSPNMFGRKQDMFSAGMGSMVGYEDRE